MLFADNPAKIPIAFASAGARNTIPTTSQIGIVNGAASLPDGFPPLTMTDESLGGIAPDGKDMNGILFLMSNIERWQAAGGRFWFDQAFANAIGGYPRGALLMQLNFPDRCWLNLVDGNTHNPDNGDFTNWQGIFTNNFIPIEQGGGPSQLATKLNIGMTAAAKLRLAVNGADVDNIALEQWVTGQIGNEAAARNAGEAQINTALANEASYRSAQDTSLGQSILAEAASRQAQINELYNLLASVYGYQQHQYFTPGDGQQVNLTSSFANTRSGYIVIISALNFSGQCPNQIQHQLYFNGVQVDGDTSCTSSVQLWTAPCSGNGATLIIQAVAITGGGGGWPSLSQHLTFLFVPN